MNRMWIRDNLLAAPAKMPFSFRYGGHHSGELLAEWPRTMESRTLDAVRTQHTLAWRDDTSGLEVRCVAVEYADYPAVEWVVYLRNAGNVNTPIIEDIQSLAACWPAEKEQAVTLFRSRGSHSNDDDFEYLAEPLDSGSTLSMVPGGRSSSNWLPFFNLQIGPAGVISAVGWTGQWAAEFAHGHDGTVACRIGLERTHLRLHPGEEIRTPRMLLLFWEGDRLAGHNALRRFILDHHTPRPNGRQLEGPLTVSHWGGMKTAEHLERITVYAREKLEYDYYWIDAGWYGPESSYSPDEHNGDWAKHVGNWNVNTKAHPRGLRPISEAANSAGMKFLLWFEPERAMYGTPLTVEHPEWFLGEPKEGENLLFDLGNPEARRWMTDYMSSMIEAHGVGLYRQDANFDPLPYWRAADAPDRQGMTEIRHIEGLYEFWDELLRRHPGLVIDNCASGGRRIDLETIGRSIPLWRSDWQCNWTADPIASQVHGMGLAYWVPLSGTGVIGGCRRAGDTYNVRSALAAALSFGIFPYESFPIREDYPYDWHRRMLAEYRRLRPLFHGDYYPLTGCTPSPLQWAAYQMHREDLGEGFVMAFRRARCADAARTFRLNGLDPAARYEVSDLNAGRSTTVSGKALMEKGLTIELRDLPFERLAGPEGRADLTLPGECAVFGPYAREDGVPTGEQLCRVPAELTVGGGHARHRTVSFDPERVLNLHRILTEIETVAFVYSPFTAHETGRATFGFGADWWYEAWIDGALISETVSTGGNRKLPATVHDHTVTVEVTKGEHLLVVRFVRGTASARLAVGGPRDLEDQRATAPGSALFVYRRELRAEQPNL